MRRGSGASIARLDRTVGDLRDLAVMVPSAAATVVIAVITAATVVVAVVTAATTVVVGVVVVIARGVFT